MRTIKDPGERRNEILDTAESLFQRHGYEKCTVNDIITEVSIAKGTFYYYFKSKEEVLDAIVSRYIDVVVSRVNEILAKTDLSPEEKLQTAFMSMNVGREVSDEVLGEMHKAENYLLHQKTLNRMVITLAPLLEQIVVEGIAKKVWSCRYPLQYMQIFLASSLALTDEGIFELEADLQTKLMAALIALLEKMLEVPEDYFLSLMIQRSDTNGLVNN